jgi:hypothetical protein
MLWTELGILLAILMLLYHFIMSWKRDGIIQAILNLTSLVSIYFTFFDPFNNTIRDTIFLPALIIGIVSFTISFIFMVESQTTKIKA